eukprot:CAMPEP_0205905760 /NCGR_PEP_ID=MMETSP1325-20131115/1540_1 /ASSEMBLY_ACC=CAM_ASM_000708 /TAXON_ID=236786 /ORGANISM="Florenciella sp., Strain RCC1007" /LENGTH=334 /DNA_ID=CAMNT_0053271699 /DNA_START=23 /DNA_END=1027 /DNA_ORIENTATION=-
MSTKGGPSTGGRVGRTRGFDRPYTQEQYICWGGQIISLSLFYALGGSGFSANAFNTVVLGLHGSIVLVSLGLWLFLETHDPTEPSCWSRRLPDSERWTKLSYDRMHMKKIEGLDHFCPWLNVSIGRSNYLPFILLVALGLCQFGLQAVVGLLWALSGAYTTAGLVFIVLHEVMVAPIWCMYVMLFGFHVYLGVRGLSTYGYLMEMKKPKGSKPKAPKAGIRRDDRPSDSGVSGAGGSADGGGVKGEGGGSAKFSKLSASEVDEELGLPSGASGETEEPSSPSAIELAVDGAEGGGSGGGGNGDTVTVTDTDTDVAPAENEALVVASTNDETISM